MTTARLLLDIVGEADLRASLKTEGDEAHPITSGAMGIFGAHSTRRRTNNFAYSAYSISRCCYFSITIDAMGISWSAHYENKNKKFRIFSRFSS